ncbi:DinB superfamily protein [mine drainage metagenome]|uniref:DinB superfamily protein n=1 Tax=mine drainage metagenome TaxID=410659 RepID=A0A1J5S4Q7_9ZZZZ
MEKQINISKQTRRNFLNLIDSLSVEQLNKIPAGMNNNIAWNFGHIVATQQLLCYTLAGAVPRVDQSLIDKYRKGTKPESFIDSDEIELLKKLSISLIDELEKDIKTDIFNNYKSYPTSYGVGLSSIEDAVNFFPMHEAMHYGVALTIKKFV